MHPAAITGILLAGGRARRMGGADKGLLRLAGRPLIAHVLDRFLPQVDTLLINANREIETYAALGYPVVQDLLPDFAGPLAGLQAGLAACATPLLATAPCDTPRLPLDVVTHLRAALDAAPTALAASARTQDRRHPTFALYRREALAPLTPYLAAGDRKIQHWQESIGTVLVNFDDEAAFANINTPQDIALMEAMP